MRVNQEIRVDGRQNHNHQPRPAAGLASEEQKHEEERKETEKEGNDFPHSIIMGKEIGRRDKQEGKTKTIDRLRGVTRKVYVGEMTLEKGFR
jgi:hypothetical protein